MKTEENKILITGASGMVGSALKKRIPRAICISTKECDLRDRKKTLQLFMNYKPERVIHLAARVGGLLANTKYVNDFYNENVSINLNVLEAAKAVHVEKVVSLLSTCIYPDEAEYPLTENQIHKGPPHESNFGYAYAKRMLDIHSRALRQQHGCNFITVIPNNLFGENDNFDLQNSHVIPALMRKLYEAKLNNENVKIWGDGSPLREFTYSGDLAKILLFFLENYNGADPINVGNTIEISIAEVVRKLADIFRFTGEIEWQTEMPNGQHRKPSDNSKFKNLCDPRYTDFDTALRNTAEWFIMNYPKVRGIS